MARPTLDELMRRSYNPTVNEDLAALGIDLDKMPAPGQPEAPAEPGAEPWEVSLEEADTGIPAGQPLQAAQLPQPTLDQLMLQDPQRPAPGPAPGPAQGANGYPEGMAEWVKSELGAKDGPQEFADQERELTQAMLMPEGYNPDAGYQPADAAALDAGRQMDDERLGVDQGAEMRNAKVYAVLDALTSSRGKASPYNTEYTGDQRIQAVRDKRIAEQQGRQKALAERTAKDQARSEQARMQDPTSPESVRLQQFVSNALGIPVEQVEGLTVWDYKAYPDLGKAMAAGRARAEKRQGALELEAAKEMARIDADARRLQSRKDFEDYQAPNRLREARASASRAAQQKDIDREIAGARDLGKRQRQYAQDLLKTGVPKYQTMFKKINERMEKALAEDGELFVGEEEVLRRSPMMWNRLPKHKRELLQMLQELKNAKIKNLSGAAVSESEMERIAASMGSNITDSEDALRAWLQQAEDALAADLETINSGDPEAAAAFAQARRGGGRPAQKLAPPGDGVDEDMAAALAAEGIDPSAVRVVQ